MAQTTRNIDWPTYPLKPHQVAASAPTPDRSTTPAERMTREWRDDLTNPGPLQKPFLTQCRNSPRRYSAKTDRNCSIIFCALEMGCPVRKFVRIALVVCLAVTAVPVVLLGLLWLWTWYETAQVESFYQKNRLLSEMRAGQRDSTNDSAPAREALLQILPLGTDREAALAVLRKGGFGCQTIAEPITDTRLRQRFIESRGLTNTPNDSRTRKDFVDCQVRSPNVIGYKTWIVDLEFDADGHLSEVGVAIWNIFL
jgi:hypothetical protein